MAKYLVDTNILIDYIRNQPYSVEFLETNLSNCFISYVNAGELIQGVRDTKELKVIMNTIDIFDVNNGTQAISRLALKILEKYNLKNKLGLIDSIVAATALETNSTLVTSNTKHFHFIEKLSLYNPKQ